MPTPAGLINFIGTYNTLPTTGNTGDVCVYNGNIHIWINGWQILIGELPKEESYIQNECLYIK